MTGSSSRRGTRFSSSLWARGLRRRRRRHGLRHRQLTALGRSRFCGGAWHSTSGKVALHRRCPRHVGRSSARSCRASRSRRRHRTSSCCRSSRRRRSHGRCRSYRSRGTRPRPYLLRPSFYSERARSIGGASSGRIRSWCRSSSGSQWNLYAHSYNGASPA